MINLYIRTNGAPRDESRRTEFGDEIHEILVFGLKKKKKKNDALDGSANECGRKVSCVFQKIIFLRKIN